MRYTSDTADLAFSGPFAWLPGASLACLANASIASDAGVYLWTVPTRSGEFVCYVGETGTSFRTRMDSHLAKKLAGRAKLYDPSELRRGVKRLIWQGAEGPLREPNTAEFARRLPVLAPELVRLVRMLRIYLAPMDLDQRLRERIAAALAAHVRRQPGLAGSFQDIEVCYWPRVGVELPRRFAVSWEHRPQGVPDAIEA